MRHLRCIGILTIALASVLACGRSNSELESQLAVLQDLGITLNPGVTTSDVLELEELKYFRDEKPFVRLYTALGGYLGREPWTPLTDHLWIIDTECIEGPGAYISIFGEFERLSRGELSFTNVKDSVNIRGQHGWVEFTFHEKRIRWDLEVEADWVDASVFTRMVELANKAGTSGSFTYFDAGGQTAVIGYETEGALKKINDATGLGIIKL